MAEARNRKGRGRSRGARSGIFQLNRGASTTGRSDGSFRMNQGAGGFMSGRASGGGGGGVLDALSQPAPSTEGFFEQSLVPEQNFPPPPPPIDPAQHPYPSFVPPITQGPTTPYQLPPSFYPQFVPPRKKPLLMP